MTVRSQDGQAVIEYVVLLPLLVVAVAVLVEVGAAFARESALRSAADRAAVARLQGDDPLVAARKGLSASMSRSLRLTVHGDDVTVEMPAGLPLLSAVDPLTLTASARTPEPRS